MRKLTLANGSVVEVECLSCVLTSGLIEPDGGGVQHFHTWLVPRYEWMYEFGRSVESVRPDLLHARNHMNNEENMKEVISAIHALTIELYR